MPSLVAEIGEAIENHMRVIGMIKTGLDDHQKAFIDAKRQEIAAKEAKKLDAPAASKADPGFPPGAQVCSKCSTKAVVIMDGCRTCLNCGDSKCG